MTGAALPLVVAHAGIEEVLGVISFGWAGAHAIDAGHKDLRLPVPPGFTLTTEVCTYYYDNRKPALASNSDRPGSYPASLNDEVKTALKAVEKLMNKSFRWLGSTIP